MLCLYGLRQYDAAESMRLAAVLRIRDCDAASLEFDLIIVCIQRTLQYRLLHGDCNTRAVPRPRVKKPHTHTRAAIANMFASIHIIEYCKVIISEYYDFCKWFKQVFILLQNYMKPSLLGLIGPRFRVT
jgi:hypothetical protein